jgi:uroporphyrinogen decarboxylase
MNAYERVMNTLQGRPADRVPVIAVLGAYGGKLTGTDLRTLYRDAPAYVAGQRAVQETFGLDLVLAPFDYSVVAEAFGAEVAWFDHQVPNVKRPAARSAAAALALPQPDLRRTARLPFVLESARLLAENYRGRVPLFAAVPAPSAIGALVLGLETWMETVLFDAPAAQRLLDYAGVFCVEWANALLAAGVDALILTEVMATAEVAPRSLFAERILPHLRAVLTEVRGPWVFHHGGGCINHNLDLIRGLPGIVGVGLGSKEDLAEARRLLGPELLLLGNLDGLTFPTATAAEVHARSLACLRTAAPAGRYILAHGGADIALSTPPENLRAMLAASEDYATDRSAA